MSDGDMSDGLIWPLEAAIMSRWYVPAASVMSLSVSLYCDTREVSCTKRVHESSWWYMSDEACCRPSYAVCSAFVLCIMAFSAAVFVSNEWETDLILSSYSSSRSFSVYSSTVPNSALLITPTKLKRPLLLLVLLFFDVTLSCVSGITLCMM